MRPASSRVITSWIIVLCFLAALPCFNGLASAQAASGSKGKLSQQSLLSERPVASMTAARRGTRNAPPALTTDTWTGSGGDNNWGTSTNWSAGVPTSADAVTIGTPTANVNMNVAGSFGTLTLSGSGDTLNIVNAETLTASGNITNNGTITLNSGGNGTELIIGVSGVTLSGTGTLNMSNNSQNFIVGSAGTDKLTNSSTIQGSGTRALSRRPPGRWSCSEISSLTPGARSRRPAPTSSCRVMLRSMEAHSPPRDLA